MYERFFGLREPPFRLVPDPAYLYLSKGHEEALAHLAFAAERGEGFVEITGEVGTGKTTLCRAFLDNLDEETEAAFIFNPKLTSTQLLEAVCDEFGISTSADDAKGLIDALNTFLMAQRARGKKTILLIDEAQNLSKDVLEQLRLLSNLETTTSKLIQIILVGQPELGDLLSSRELRQLAQRITLSSRLHPLSARQTTAYIRHRLHIAGANSSTVFTPGALKRIHRYSRGVPRLINIVCDRALLTAFVQGQKRVTIKIARQAVSELPDRKGTASPDTPAWKKAVCILAFLAVCLIAITIIDTGGDLREPMPESPPRQSVRKKTADRQPNGDPLPPAEPSPPTALETSEPRTLAQVLVGLDTLNSRKHAVAEVLALWGIKADKGAVADKGGRDPAFIQRSAALHGLKILTVSGDIEQLQRLNLPAVIPFRQPEDSCCGYLALLSLEADRARLSTGSDDPNDWIASDRSEVASRWAGRAYVVWEDVFNSAGVISPTSPRDAIGRLQVFLKTIGFSGVAENKIYDGPTRRAVIAVQRKYGLEDDGLVGPFTKIAMLHEQTAFPVPRLKANQPAVAREAAPPEKGGRIP
jgi:general secretion pathway protein A